MMQFLSSLLLIVVSASAFSTPSYSTTTPTPTRGATSTTTQLQMDVDALHHVANSGQDAVKMLIMECDHEECAMVDGWKDTGSGQWNFENRMGGSMSDAWEQSKEHSYKILMMEIEDVE